MAQVHTTIPVPVWGCTVQYPLFQRGSEPSLRCVPTPFDVLITIYGCIGLA